MRGLATTIVFLAKELDYRLRKNFGHMPIRGQWYRTHGNEHGEFDDAGLTQRRDMSANDVPIAESERKY